MRRNKKKEWCWREDDADYDDDEEEEEEEEEEKGKGDREGKESSYLGRTDLHLLRNRGNHFHLWTRYYAIDR